MAAATAFQGLLEGFLPWSLFDSLEAGTRTFMLECRCGLRRDLWEAGGVKGGGTEESTLARCPACEGRRWHRKRKKTPGERRESISTEGREPVLLSSHAWWASALTWGSAAMFWSLPLFIAGTEASAIERALVWLASFVAGWVGPYFWLSTRYRFGRHVLQLRSGCFGRDLAYECIASVTRERKWLTMSFAFDTDWLTINYPSRFGGYSVSPRERQLFLELLSLRCPNLAYPRAHGSGVALRIGESMSCRDMSSRPVGRSPPPVSPPAVPRAPPIPL